MVRHALVAQYMGIIPHLLDEGGIVHRWLAFFTDAQSSTLDTRYSSTFIVAPRSGPSATCGCCFPALSLFAGITIAARPDLFYLFYQVEIR